MYPQDPTGPQGPTPYPGQQPGYPPTGGQPYIPYVPPTPPAQQGNALSRWWRGAGRGMRILAVVAVLLLSCCSCGGILAAIGSHATTTGGIPVAGQTATTATTPAATATPTATPKPETWQTIKQFSGNGITKTDTFTIPADTWHLAWTCDPSSFSFSYNVIISVYAGDGSIADYAAVNTLCQSGNTSGVTTERTGAGDFYLDINSEAAWTAAIQVLQ